MFAWPFLFIGSAETKKGEREQLVRRCPRGGNDNLSAHLVLNKYADTDMNMVAFFFLLFSH